MHACAFSGNIALGSGEHVLRDDPMVMAYPAFLIGLPVRVLSVLPGDAVFSVLIPLYPALLLVPGWRNQFQWRVQKFWQITYFTGSAFSLNWSAEMRILVFPRDPNPYQGLLYSEMQQLGAEVSLYRRIDALANAKPPASPDRDRAPAYRRSAPDSPALGIHIYLPRGATFSDHTTRGTHLVPRLATDLPYARNAHSLDSS